MFNIHSELKSWLVGNEEFLYKFHSVEIPDLGSIFLHSKSLKAVSRESYCVRDGVLTKCYMIWSLPACWDYPSCPAFPGLHTQYCLPFLILCLSFLIILFIPPCHTYFFTSPDYHSYHSEPTSHIIVENPYPNFPSKHLSVSKVLWTYPDCSY